MRGSRIDVPVLFLNVALVIVLLYVGVGVVHAFYDEYIFHPPGSGCHDVYTDPDGRDTITDQIVPC